MSGTVKALRIVRATAPQVSRGPTSPRPSGEPLARLFDDLAGAARGFDPLAGGRAEGVRVHRERLAQLALGEDLHRDALALGQALRPEYVGRYLGPGIEALLQRREVHGLGVGAEGLERHRLLHVRPAQLPHPHVDRVLATLEARPLPVARAGSRALLAPPGGLARSRALAPAHALARPSAAAGRLEGMQPDPLVAAGHHSSSIFTRCWTA